MIMGLFYVINRLFIHESNIILFITHFLSPQTHIKEYISVWNTHTKFQDYRSQQAYSWENGGVGEVRREGGQVGRGEGEEGLRGLEEEIGLWLEGLPEFVYQYFYSKKKFLSEVCLDFSLIYFIYL